MGKKVCPRLDPSFKRSPSAGDKDPASASPPGVRRRSGPAGPPPPAPASPVRAVGSIAMAVTVDESPRKEEGSEDENEEKKDKK